MIVRVLVEYVDPMDNSLPPQIYIREWKSVEVIPMEWYKILSNGTKYFLILMDIGTIEYDRK